MANANDDLIITTNFIAIEGGTLQWQMHLHLQLASNCVLNRFDTLAYK